jgi:MFS family permease
MIASACGMVVVLLGGKFITMWETRFGDTNPFGFVTLFIVGLVTGLIAIFFLSRIPEVDSTKKDDKEAFDFKVFFKPLQDKNFLTLIIFVSAWMFAIQLAAPFYGVYMIDNLKVDFSTITILGTFATFATLFMMKIWGPISDKLGNKPVIIVSGWFLIIIPFLWVLAVPGNFYMPVLLAHILSGAFMAGAGLSQFNILIKLSPQEGRSVYLALFSAITGVVGAVAPIVGGSLSNILGNFSVTVANYTVSNLHVIFLISAGLQALTIFFILKVKEPRASTPVAVIMQLKNDLNPQTGIAGATDFMMVELKRTEGILRKIDKVTDDLAGKSEATIGKVLDKGESIIKKPLDRIKDFFKED